MLLNSCRDKRTKLWQTPAKHKDIQVSLESTIEYCSHMSSFSFPPSARVKRLCLCGTLFVVLSANGRDGTGNPYCPAASKILKIVFRRKVKAQYSLMVLGAEWGFKNKTSKGRKSKKKPQQHDIWHPYLLPPINLRNAKDCSFSRDNIHQCNSTVVIFIFLPKTQGDGLHCHKYGPSSSIDYKFSIPAITIISV